MSSFVQYLKAVALQLLTLLLLCSAWLSNKGYNVKVMGRLFFGCPIVQCTIYVPCSLKFYLISTYSHAAACLILWTSSLLRQCMHSNVKKGIMAHNTCCPLFEQSKKKLKKVQLPFAFFVTGQNFEALIYATQRDSVFILNIRCNTCNHFRVYWYSI